MAAPDDAQLHGALAEFVAAARRPWPSVTLPTDEFMRFVRERVEAPEALAPARWPDLFIACACARGDGAAIVAFEGAFFSDLRGALARLRLDETSFDEAAQRLRRELFVAEPGKRPKIAEYGARGDLRGWFRVTAVRSALKLLRGRRHDAGFEDEQLLERMPAADQAPELAYLKELYRPTFKTAFQEALDSLSAKEQNLLRQHLVDGLTVDQLGALHGVHRATAARWVAAAKESLLKRTRDRFMIHVRVGRDECDSIMRLVHSQLDVTIRRRLSAAGNS